MSPGAILAIASWGFFVALVLVALYYDVRRAWDDHRTQSRIDMLTVGEERERNRLAQGDAAAEAMDLQLEEIWGLPERAHS